MNVTTYVKIVGLISINGDANVLEFSRPEFELHRVKIEW